MTSQEVDIEEEEESGTKLPFDPRTLILSLCMKLHWLLIGVIITGILAVTFALLLTERTYKSQSVMIYQANSAEEDPSTSSEPSLFTLISMIKLPSNIEDLRQKLEIPASISTIGQAISVEVERKTSLVTIEVQWDDPQLVASMANSIREIFLHNQFSQYEGKLKNRIEELENNIKTTTDKLKDVDGTLRTFTMENNIIDLSKEAQWYLEELTNLNILYDQAKIEKSTVELQVENVGLIIKQIEQRVAVEKSSSAAATDAISETNIKIQRLRESIIDDKQQRSREALLEQKKLTLDAADKNLKFGVISPQEYQKALSEYNAQVALTIDTEEVKSWKDEIEKLDSQVIPEEGGSTASGNLLTSIMMREFEIKLSSVSVDKKLEHLEDALKRTRTQLDKIPTLERKLITLQRDVTTFENEKIILESELVRTKRQLEVGGRPFALVALAKPPIRPSKSNRKTIFAGVMFFGSATTTILVLCSVLLNLTVKTGRELELRLNVPILMEFPSFSQISNPRPGQTDGKLTEQLRILSRKLQTLTPQKGTRIIFVSAGHQEGCSFVATNLAAAWGRQEKKVLLIDGQLRFPREINQTNFNKNLYKSSDPLDRLLKLLPSKLRDFYHRTKRKGIERRFLNLEERIDINTLRKEQNDLGLSTLFETDLPLEKVAQESVLEDVKVIPRGSQETKPDVLNTKRMSQLLEQAQKDFDYTIIDAPPLGPYFDAEALADGCDAIIFVARANQCHGGLLKKMVERLESSGTPILGAVLTDVSWPYYREY
jgi:polysaccharide biosynthesis transport protein